MRVPYHVFECDFSCDIISDVFEGDYSCDIIPYPRMTFFPVEDKLAPLVSSVTATHVAPCGTCNFDPCVTAFSTGSNVANDDSSESVSFHDSVVYSLRRF